MGVDVTRFIKEKMLMFSKLPIKWFAYDFFYTSCFSTEEIQEIYDQYSVIKCHLYLNFIDTDSCSFSYICLWNWFFD